MNCPHGSWKDEDLPDGMVRETCLKCGTVRAITPRWITGRPVFKAGYHRPPPLDISGPTGDWRRGHFKELGREFVSDWRMSNWWDNGMKALEARA